MNNNYIIRKLHEDDYEKYLKLINQFRPTKFTKDKYLEILNKININSEIWIIELNNELVGTGTILYEYKFIHDICILAHIEDICIDESYRGQKFGKILINYLINESTQKNCYKITLYCSEELEKFYKFCNFEKRGIQMAIYIK